jgi:hypothetical protein
MTDYEKTVLEPKGLDDGLRAGFSGAVPVSATGTNSVWYKAYMRGFKAGRIAGALLAKEEV